MRPPSDLPNNRRRTRRWRLTSKWRIALIVVVLLIVVLLLSARSLANFYVDFLWFDSVNRADVFWAILRAKVLLGLGCTLLFTALAYVSLSVADRLAPTVRPSGVEEEVLDRVRAFVEPRQRLLRLGVALLFGIIAGIPAAGHWQDWLLFRNAVSFNVEDPLFGEDVSWYVFRLPFLNFFVGWLFAAVLVITVLTAVAHYLNGGIRTTGPAPHVTPHVKLHLSLLLAGLAVLKAGQYWLRRYGLTTSTRGFTEGAGYTDVNATLPALNLLILISLAAAVMLVLNVRQRGWRLPVIAVGLWAVVSIVAGTVYPALIQKFRVEPSLSKRENEYVQRNIEMTRRAFALADSVSSPVPVTYGQVDTVDVEGSVDTLANVRLLDPNQRAILEAFTQQKRLDGSFYQFVDLDVDRYVVDGRLQQVVVASRVVADRKSLPNRSWEATYLGYTHGHGLVAAPASKITADGLPSYLPEENATALGVQRPEIYFADGMPGAYVVANSSRASGEAGPDGQGTSYAGTGGVRVSSVWRRLAFALHFGEYNLFGSGLIEQDSRLMWVRDVRDRVSKIAPFLALDNDPYPVSVDGRVLWVADAYTTTSRYPYSEQADTSQLDQGSGLRKDFNYVRNSVKAVVDAYDGTVRLYLMDRSDPIAVAWSKAFPGLFLEKDQLPPSLVDHLRYPEDLLRVQTSHIGKYQLGDADQFFDQDERWCVTQFVPQEQTADGATGSAAAAAAAASTARVPSSAKCASTRRFVPYYTLFTPPGATEAEFSLIRPFQPFTTDDGLQTLRAFAAGTVGDDMLPELTLYSVQGATLPKGPYTAHLQIQSALAAVFTLEDQRGSEILFGDMQIINVGDGLAYVRPVYVKATSGTAIPNLKYVVAFANDRVVQSNSLSGAINLLFPEARIDLGERDTSSTPTTPTDPTGTPEQPTPTDQTVEQLLAAATALFAEADDALAAGDLGLYQQKVEEAEDKVRQAEELLNPSATTTVPPTTAP